MKKRPPQTKQQRKEAAKRSLFYIERKLLIKERATALGLTKTHSAAIQTE